MDMVETTESRQGTEQTRTFDLTNESADCWSAAHSHNFNIRVKSKQHKKSILIWLVEKKQWSSKFLKKVSCLLPHFLYILGYTDVKKLILYSEYTFSVKRIFFCKTFLKIFILHLSIYILLQIVYPWFIVISYMNIIHVDSIFIWFCNLPWIIILSCGF